MSETMPFDDPLAPPTSGMMEIDGPPSKWPTVIGVFGIILAAIGLLCSCVGYFIVPLQRMGVEFAAKAGQSNPAAEAQLKAAEQFNIFFMILLTLGLGLAAWLLVGSIALLRRRCSSRTHLIAYAMTSLFLLSLDIALQILMFQAAVAELHRMGEGQRIADIWINVAIQGFFTIVFGVGYQVFLLVWFSRAKIKQEVAAWRA